MILFNFLLANTKVHTELRRASFKRHVEENIREKLRFSACDVNASADLPRITYLKRSTWDQRKLSGKVYSSKISFQRVASKSFLRGLDVGPKSVICKVEKGIYGLITCLVDSTCGDSHMINTNLMIEYITLFDRLYRN